MNPNSGESQPQFEVPSPGQGEAAGSQSLEKSGPATPENRPQKQSLQASRQAANTMALPGQAISIGDETATKATPIKSDGDDNAAQDTDRIEKQWIDKLEAAVAKTQDDPYEQKKAVSRVKASYIHKRFKKTIKTEDAVGE